MASLSVDRGADVGMIFSITGDRCVIGRDKDCNISHVFRGNSKVSRRHALVFQSQDRYFLEDLNSRNGTRLNGSKIDRRVMLADGDRVEVGDIAFVFHAEITVMVPAGGESREGPAAVIDETSQSDIYCSIAVPAPGKASSVPGLGGDRKLKAILDLLSTLGKSIDRDRMLDELLGGLFTVFPQADRGFVALKVGSQVVPQIVRHRDDDDISTVHVSRTIIDHIVNTKEAILSEDIASDSRFGVAQSLMNAEVRSLMCAPLIDADGHVLGMVEVESTSAVTKFKQEDLEVLASIAPQAAIVLQYSRLHEDSVRRSVFERDLELARQVQGSLLPKSQPAVDNYEFFAYYDAAQHVGGDYYDYIPLPNGRLAVVLADVSGKGVSAALLMAKVAGELKYLLSSEADPAVAVGRMNDNLCADGVTGQFVTLLATILDMPNHRATIINAGHMGPLLRDKSGRIREVAGELHGPAIGMFPDKAYKHDVLELAPGDLLAVFTDGITEAENERNELYGFERLRAVMQRAGETAAEVGDAIVKDVRSYTGAYPQSDDICLTCFGRVR